MLDNAKTLTKEIIKNLKLFPAAPVEIPASFPLSLWSRNHINWRRLTSHGFGALVDPALIAMVFEQMFIKHYRTQLFEQSPAARLLRKDMTDILDPHGGSRIDPKTLQVIKNRWVWIDADILRGVDMLRDGDSEAEMFDASTIYSRIEMIERRASMSGGMDAILRSIYRAPATHASNGKTGKEESSSMPKEVHDALKIFMRVSSR